MNLFGRFSKAAKTSFYGTPAEYELAGKIITCSRCGHTRFTRARPFNILFAVPAFEFVTTLEYENCGMVLWFSKAPHTREQESR